MKEITITQFAYIINSIVSLKFLVFQFTDKVCNTEQILKNTGYSFLLCNILLAVKQIQMHTGDLANSKDSF